MGFWLQLGVSGFRVDAVPFFLETAGVADGERDLPDPHAYLRELRAFLGRRSGDAILLGEVNLQHQDQLRFFGGDDGDELTMLFDFIGMQRLYLSLARGDARPLVEALRSRPPVARESQWATFVRNHDELTLDKLSDEERQEVFDAFGPEEEMQIYGRGLRRRLPPMLDGDPRRLRMVYSLLFSPARHAGAVLRRGDRHGREPRGRGSAWRCARRCSGRRAGTAASPTAPPSRLAGPVVEGAFGPEHVNVEAQRRDPDSLLSFMTLLIRRYRECPELGWGEFEALDQPEPAVLAHRSTWGDASIVAVHNLSADAKHLSLQLEGCDEETRLVDLLVDGITHPDARGRVELPLEGYGYRWLRVVPPGSRLLA